METMIQKFAAMMLGIHASMVDKDLPEWEALYAQVPASDRAVVEQMPDEDVFLMCCSIEHDDLGNPFFYRESGDKVIVPVSINVIIQSMYERYQEPKS